jgi:hypothetical protein
VSTFLLSPLFTSRSNLLPVKLVGSCKAQLVSFVASCLGLPTLFESNSANSVNDFMSILSDDTSSFIQTLLCEVIDELSKQETLEEVSNESIALILVLFLSLSFCRLCVGLSRSLSVSLTL